MPTREEWVARLSDRKPVIPDVDSWRTAALAQRLERAKSVLDHPGWVEFEHDVQDEIDRVTARLENAKTQLVNSLDSTESLLSLRFQIRHLEGLLLGLRFSKDLMPGAVAEGNQSLQETVR